MTTPNYVRTRNFLCRWLVAPALALLSLSASAAPFSRATGAAFANATEGGAKAVWTTSAGAAATFGSAAGKATATIPAALPWPGKAQAQFMANMKAMADPMELGKSIATGRGLGFGLAAAGIATLANLALEAGCIELVGGTWKEGVTWNECHFTDTTVQTYWTGSVPATESSTRAQSCNIWGSTRQSGSYGVYQTDSGFCFAYRQDGSYLNGVAVQPYRTQTNKVRDGSVPLSPSDAEQKIGRLVETWCNANDPKCAQAFKDMVEKGGVVEVQPAPDVTGPASGDPVTTTRTEQRTVTNPDGSTTSYTINHTTTTTQNFTYNGDTVTRTENTTTTTTTTNNQTGQTTTETTGTQQQSDEKTKDPCEGRPDLASCAKLDSPSEDMPKRTENVGWSIDNLGFGSGSCPGPVTWSDSLGTHALQFGPICDVLSTIVKPLVLLFAALAAAFIVLPRET